MIDTTILRAFMLTVNNRKKHKPGTPIIEHHCPGGIFAETKHVVIDIDAGSGIPPLYRNLDEMREKLGWWGDVTIEGLEETAQ